MSPIFRFGEYVQEIEPLDKFMVRVRTYNMKNPREDNPRIIEVKELPVYLAALPITDDQLEEVKRMIRIRGISIL